MNHIKLLERFNACGDGVEYAGRYKSLKTAWRYCKRGDWMLWLAAKLNIDRRLLVGAAGQCASAIKHLMTDPRSIAALDACKKYANGEIGVSEIRAAYAADAANQKQTADICRKMLTKAVFEAIDKQEAKR